MSRPRDSQRSRVYAAERAAFGGGSLDAGAPDTLEATQARAEGILRSTWVREQYPRAPRSVSVEDTRARCATAYATRVEMPKWSRAPENWWVLFHELAHTILNWVPGRHDRAGHGWEFCATYVALVRELRGEADADRLVAAFKAGRVRYRRPPQISPERRAALRARARAWVAAGRPGKRLAAASPAGDGSSPGGD